jgi:hypothetical protein
MMKISCIPLWTFRREKSEARKPNQTPRSNDRKREIEREPFRWWI